MLPDHPPDRPASRPVVPAAVSTLVAHVIAGRRQPATVVGAHRYALYLAVGGSVFPVVTADAVALPTAVRLGLASGSVSSLGAADQPWGVAAGDVVGVGGGRVTLPHLDVVAARTWRPARVRVVDPHRVGCSDGRQGSHLSTQLDDDGRVGCSDGRQGSHLSTQLEHVSTQLEHVSTQLGLSGAGGEGGWLADGIRDAVAAASRSRHHPPGVGCSDGRQGSHFSTQLDEVGAAVGWLVGRGPGLTPAGDDALAGALLVAHALGTGTDLADAVRARLHATTAVSAALLAAAADGYAARPVVTLVDAAVANRPDAVRRALPAVLAIGHTSGADTVTGIRTALVAVGCSAGRQGSHLSTQLGTTTGRSAA